MEIIHSLSQPTEGRKDLGPGIFPKEVLFGIVYHPDLDVAFNVERLGTIFLPGRLSAGSLGTLG